MPHLLLGRLAFTQGYVVEQLFRNYLPNTI